MAKQAVDSTQPAATNWNDVNSALTSVEPGTGRVIAMAQNHRARYPRRRERPPNTEYNYNVDAIYGGTRLPARLRPSPIILAQWLISAEVR